MYRNRGGSPKVAQFYTNYGDLVVNGDAMTLAMLGQDNLAEVLQCEEPNLFPLLDFVKVTTLL